MSKIIGIDLGTTNSVVAVFEAGEPIVLPNKDGARTTPSAVAFQDDGTVLVGQMAKRQAVQNPMRTVASIKRFMGRRFGELGKDATTMPYRVVAGADDLACVDIGGKQITPQEISAKVLGELKTAAEQYLGQKVTRAVITVPAYFNDHQRQATKDAGEIAGLKVERIINEPTAAALAYGLDKSANHKVAVFDFGGGTFDVTILEITKEGDEQVFEVLSTSGDTHLGGDDLDQCLIDWMAEQFRQESGGIDLRQDMMALQRLKDEAEKAKRDLSTAPQTQISIPFISGGPSGPMHLNMSLTRAKFEELCAGVFNRLRGPCTKALADADLRPADIQEVVLVGGSTRIPLVQAIAREIFGREPNRTMNPDEAVALGAAVQGGLLDESSPATGMTFLDVTPLSLGVEIEHGAMAVLIERNTTIPCKRRETFTTSTDMQTQVEVKVYQGERPMAADNRLLGRFMLANIPPAPRGIPKIEVSFDIDANGILQVTAVETGTGRKANITVEGSSGLDRREVERMRRDAEAHASEDQARLAAAEVFNQAEAAIFAARRFEEDAKDKVAAELLGALSAAATETEAAVATKDVGKAKAALTKLQGIQRDASVALYNAAATAGGPVQPAAPAGGVPNPGPSAGGVQAPGPGPSATTATTTPVDEQPAPPPADAPVATDGVIDAEYEDKGEAPA